MRIMTVVIIGMFAACVAFPATAAKKQTNLQAAAAPKTWEQCHEQALRHGLTHGHKGNDEFIKECMAGNTRPSTAAKKVAAAPKTWEQCHEQALRHGLTHGHKGNDEFIKECMAGNTLP